MARNLPAVLLFAKNRVEQDQPWLVLLDVVIPTTPPLSLYVVNNNEDVVFCGQTYTAFPFSVALPQQGSSGEIGKTILTVDDVEKLLRGYIDSLNGGYGTTVKMRVVNMESLALESAYVDLEFDFDLLDVSIDGDAISFSLGGPNLLRQALPAGRYLSDHCMWVPHYGGAECKLSQPMRDLYSICNGTRADCRIRLNTRNFGGHPGLADSSMRLVW